MAYEKKFVSVDGLNEFLTKLTAAYAANTSESTKFIVNYAKEAGKATQDGAGATIATTYLKGVSYIPSNGSTATALTPDANRVVTLDLSNYVTKDALSAALNFKGAKTGAQLKALTAATVTNGDVYTCTEDDLTGTTLFHAGYEYAATLSGDPAVLTWVELGKYLDLSGYASKVSGATEGNLAKLSSAGDLVDSGIAAANIGAGTITSGNQNTVTGGTVYTYLTTAANHQQNTIETVKVNGTVLTPDSDLAVDITVPTVATAIADGDDGYATGNQVYDYIADAENVVKVTATAASSYATDTTASTKVTSLKEATKTDIDGLFS